MKKGQNDIYCITDERFVCRVVVAVLGDHEHEGPGGDVPWSQFWETIITKDMEVIVVTVLGNHQHEGLGGDVS